LAPWTYEGRWFLGAYEGHMDAARRRAAALSDFYALRIQRRAWLDLLEDSFELTRRSVAAAANGLALLEERAPAIAPTRLDLLTSPLPPEPLGVVDRLAVLTQLTVARRVGVQALTDLAAVSHEVRVEAGDAVFERGQTAEHFYLLLTGKVSARREQPEVERQYFPGDIVGGVVAFSERSPHWRAVALTPARLLAIPREAWFDLMEDHFEFAQAHFAVLAARRDRILEDIGARSGPEGVVLG